jgi:integrase
MSYDGVERVIKATTAGRVGVDVSPHLLHTSAASTAATCGGANLHLGSALLNHTHRTVTDEHYNRASSLSAAERLRQIVRRYQEGAG